MLGRPSSSKGPSVHGCKAFQQTKEQPCPFLWAGWLWSAGVIYLPATQHSVLGSRLSGRETDWLQDPEATQTKFFVLTTNVNLFSDDCWSRRLLPVPPRLLSSIIFYHLLFFIIMPLEGNLNGNNTGFMVRNLHVNKCPLHCLLKQIDFG